MKRRDLLLGAGAAGTAAVFGSGAFTQVQADRDVTIGIDADSDALLALRANDEVASVFEDEDIGELVIDTEELGTDTQGFNVGATAQIGATEEPFGDTVVADSEAFKIVNNFDDADQGGQNEFDVEIDLSDLPEDPEESAITVEFVATHVDATGSELASRTAQSGSPAAFGDVAPGEEILVAIRIETESAGAEPEDLTGSVVIEAGPDLADETPPPDTDDPVVNIDQDEEFAAIQPAIDAAEAGDTINIDGGEFVEDLAITVSNLTIQTSALTTVVGSITVQASGVALEDLQIEADDIARQLVFVESGVSDVAIRRCSFEGIAEFALEFAGDEGEVIDCTFDEVSVTGDHVLVVNGPDVVVRGCDFFVVDELEAVLVEAEGVEIDDCNFNAVDVVVERFIVIFEEVSNVLIDGCNFGGEVREEVVVLSGVGSEIVNCDFENVVKIDTDFSLILVAGEDARVDNCVFDISDELDVVVLVNASGVEIDNCTFTTDDVTVNRFITVLDSATNVIIVRCTFAGSVSDTTIEHAGSGEGSEIRDCDFDDVELEDGATLIIRVDDVTVEEVDVQIVEIQIQNDFAVFTSLEDAVNAAEPDTEVVVQPGVYEADLFDIDTQNLEIRGPKAGIPGDAAEREPADPETEAIIDGEVFLTRDDLIVDGFTLRERTMVELGDPGGTFELRNLVVDGDGLDPGIQAFIFDDFDVSIQDNLITGSERGIELSPVLDDSELTDTVDVTDNTIEDAEIGIEVDEEQVANEDLRTIRDGNTFVDTETEILPEPEVEQQATLFDPPEDEDDVQVFTGSEAIEDAIEEATEDARIEVAPGEYEATGDDSDSIDIEVPNLELAGPQEGTDGADDDRDPEDPETEAVIEASLGISTFGPSDEDDTVAGVVIDGFTIQDVVPFREPPASSDDPDRIRVQNNIIGGTAPTFQDEEEAAVTPSVSDENPPVTIENNLIGTDQGVSIGVWSLGVDAPPSSLTLFNNTIEADGTGIELRLDDPAPPVEELAEFIFDNQIQGAETGIELILPNGAGFDDEPFDPLIDINGLDDINPAISVTPGRVDTVEASADDVTDDTTGTYTADLINTIDTTDRTDVVVEDPRIFDVWVDFGFVRTNGVDAGDIVDVEEVDGSRTFDAQDLVDGDVTIPVSEPDTGAEIEVTFDEDVGEVSDTLEVSIDDDDRDVAESDTDTDEFTVDL